MNRDPKGFYRRLGLSSDATEKQIKEAFRHLAKQYHPDLSSDPTAKQKFQAINEAYETLCDAGRRAKYDALGYEPEIVTRQQETENKPPPEPIKCSCCGKSTAQPRYVVFWKIASFIFVSVRTPIQGVFCRQCADLTAFKASLASAFLGWWSVHGLFLTPIVIIRNALGGQQDKDNNENLAFFNATIFFRRGQYDLAYALASPLRTSAVDRFNVGARLICQIVEREQLTDTSRKLVSQWGFRLREFVKNVAPGTAIVATVVGGIFFDDISRYYGVRSAPQMATKSPLNVVGLTPVPMAPVGQSISTPLSAACNPANGTVIGGYYQKRNQGHSIEIRNGSNSAAVVKLKDVNGRTYLSFYVRQNGTAQVSGMQDGQYKIQFAYTDGLSADCRTINKMIAASEFPTSESLMTKYMGSYVEWVSLTYTLHNVVGGNVRPRTIDMSSFTKD